MQGETSSGVTFEHIKQYVLKARPKITWLENVPEVAQGVGNDELDYASDAEYIQTQSEQNDFVAVTLSFNCNEYGSLATRLGLWVVILTRRSRMR